MDNNSSSDEEDIFDEADEDEDEVNPEQKQTNGKRSDSDEEMDYSD